MMVAFVDDGDTDNNRGWCTFDAIQTTGMTCSRWWETMEMQRHAEERSEAFNS